MHFLFLKTRSGIAALVTCCSLVPAGPSLAQNIDTAAIKTLVAGRKDSVKSKIKSYKEVVPTTAKTSRGFFSIHKVDDRWLVEIPDSLLGRDLLVVNRIVKAAAGATPAKAMGGVCSYAGDAIGQDIIRFDRLTEDKIFLRSTSFGERSADSSSNGLYRNVLNNNMQPIEAAFPIKAINEQGKSEVIDLTDFIASDNSILYFESGIKPFAAITTLAADRSYIDHIRAFPLNIEIGTVRTYNNLAPGGPPRTYELNSSIVLLPAMPMRGRPGDVRVGFFADDYVDFDDNPQGVRKEDNILRWRMEPKSNDLDREKYLRGELVEPANPIVIYIDPLTPKKWVPYLIQGINDWQAAFETAGFRNAIIGKEAPVGDSTWSMEDARHSVLVYHPSDTRNAMGPNVHDPRSGEILETHISWYHNVMDLLYKWYFIQAGAVDPRARHPHFDDSLMGTLIRFVSSHEVGHTLGLMHNFGASSTVPVENLRNKAWVDAHGHTPSIMDYARFDYVAQPEDSIDENGLFPHIGDYDKWAIRWGYRWLPKSMPASAEKDTLNAWVVRQLAGGPQFFYGAQLDPLDPMNFRGSNPDPRDQNEDLGDDAMKAGEYGIRNLKRIEPHLLEWTREPHGDYAQVGDMYKELVGQYGRYMGHVLKNIGGVMITPKTIDQPGSVFSYPAKEKQQRAMAFFNTQLFTTPSWLIDQKLYNLATVGFNEVAKVQEKVIDGLLDPARIDRLIEEETTLGLKAYTTSEMLSQLQSGIFGELTTGKSIDVYRRDLQKAYVNKLTGLIRINAKGEIVANMSNDGYSILKAHARELSAAIKQSIPRYPKSMTRDHLEDMYGRLELILKPRN
ncbi:MAG TPA: zinc-dependent metalloprotease [Puia sp.]|nr:zinc-dependent metalloprotease [Puia sp.]